MRPSRSNRRATSNLRNSVGRELSIPAAIGARGAVFRTVAARERTEPPPTNSRPTGPNRLTSHRRLRPADPPTGTGPAGNGPAAPNPSGHDVACGASPGPRPSNCSIPRRARSSSGRRRSARSRPLLDRQPAIRWISPRAGRARPSCRRSLRVLARAARHREVNHVAVARTGPEHDGKPRLELRLADQADQLVVRGDFGMRLANSTSALGA